MSAATKATLGLMATAVCTILPYITRQCQVALAMPSNGLGELDVLQLLTQSIVVRDDDV